MIKDKNIVGTIAIICVTVLQVMAWHYNHDGQVFALTSFIIGGVIGSLFGFDLGNRKGRLEGIKDAVKDKMQTKP